MGMRREPGAGGHAVVVGHEQQPVMRVAGVVVATEAEAVVAVEPPDLRVRPAVGSANVDRGGHGARSNRIRARRIPDPATARHASRASRSNAASAAPTSSAGKASMYVMR